MRNFNKASLILASIFISAATLAGTNDLFEAKTATDAIEQTSKNLLSNVTPAERKAIKTATQANRKALKAYERCPTKPKKAAKVLEKAFRKLDRHQQAMFDLSVSSVEIDALVKFGDATGAEIEALLESDSVCDEGHNRVQHELVYSAAAAFVSFAQGWGDMSFGAHGSFGDFAAQSAAPDHIHSETYYGVVITGVLKNPFGEMPNGDVASAKPLPAGSFWSVPANAIHTTACDGGPDDNCLFYFHSRAAFDFDTDVSEGDAMDDAAQEISASEIAEELGKDSAIISPFARMFTLWGDRAIGAHGTAGEFIPGGSSPEHIHSYSYHGVVLSGTMVNPFLGQSIEDARPLHVGDYWFVPAGVDHVTACISIEPCTFYFHSEGAFDFIVEN